jgi:hypothetical protein
MLGGLRSVPAGKSVAGRQPTLMFHMKLGKGDVMKLGLLVIEAAAVFAATPAFAATCDKPVIVTGGQVAMYSHPTQVRHDPQPVRVAVAAGAHGLPVRSTVGAKLAAQGGVVTARCVGCCKTSSPREALSAAPAMKACTHRCGCAHD